VLLVKLSVHNHFTFTHMIYVFSASYFSDPQFPQQLLRCSILMSSRCARHPSTLFRMIITQRTKPNTNKYTKSNCLFTYRLILAHTTLPCASSASMHVRQPTQSSSHCANGMSTRVTHLSNTHRQTNKMEMCQQRTVHLGKQLIACRETWHLQSRRDIKKRSHQEQNPLENKNHN